MDSTPVGGYHDDFETPARKMKHVFGGTQKTCDVGPTPIRIDNNEYYITTVVKAIVGENEDKGETALMKAVNYGNNEMALVNGRADVNIADDKGVTALMRAAFNGHNEIALELINGGADVNIADDKGVTALMRAAYNGHNEIALELINGGADVNMTDCKGNSALVYSVKNIKVLTVLVQHGKALVNLRNKSGRTPLFYAMLENNVADRYFLQNGGNLHVTDNFNVSILSYLIYDGINKSINQSQLHERLGVFKDHGIGNQTIVQAIINAIFCKLPLYISSARVNILPVLGIAVDLYEESQGQRIIENIVAVVTEGDETKVALNYLPHILSMLIDLGADPNTADENGNTACHYLVQLVLRFSGNSRVIDKLEEFGLTLNKKNCNQETPLIFLLTNVVQLTREKLQIPGMSQIVEVSRVLCKNPAIINETSQSGLSVFHLILQLVQEGLSLQDQHYQETFLHEILQLLQLFSPSKVKKGVTVNKVDDQLNSPLHYWAALALPLARQYTSKDAEVKFENHIETILNHLLSCGALLNSRNQYEETPLHRSKTWSALKLLVDAGANTNVVDAAKRSPILVAAQNRLFLEKPEYFYPDVTVDSTTFWRNVTSMGFDVLASDNDGDSTLSRLLEAEAFVLAKGLVEVFCDENLHIQDEALVSVLNTICKDKSTQTIWKTIFVQMILKSRRRPLHLSFSLRLCCINILDGMSTSTAQHTTSKDMSRSDIKTDALSERVSSVTTDSVHWQVAKQLLLYGASGLSCLELVDDCPELKDLLIKSLMVIPWTSCSKTYEKRLAEVARRRNCKLVEGTTYWHHCEPIASGRFGRVFAGINEKDGMEVAIKRTEKLLIVRREYKRELRTFTALTDCKQIVQYLGYFESKEFSYVILELMEGTLDDYFVSSVYNSSKSTFLSKDVVMGLKYLHDQNIIHRDLKPSNILYKSHPCLCLKIADFGLSRPLNMDLSVTVMSASVGARGWIAPEVIKSSTNVHSMSSDIFSCGLILHYLFSKQKHPFDPADCTGKSDWQILTERESNILNNRMEGWHNSLLAEVSHLVQRMLEVEDKRRPSASDLLDHPMFWSNKKTIDFLVAIGDQPEFQCPRAKRPSLTAVEKDLEANVPAIIMFSKWNDTRYKDMPAIYAEMTNDKKGKTPIKYDTGSVVELVRFIRNTTAHASDASRKLVLSNYVFLTYYPNLVMEVYKTVIKHGWDARVKIKHVINK